MGERRVDKGRGIWGLDGERGVGCLSMYLKEVYEIVMVEFPHAGYFLGEEVSCTLAQTGLVNHLHCHTLWKEFNKESLPYSEHTLWKRFREGMRN